MTPIKPLPTVQVTDQCCVRTWRNKWHRYTWLDLICLGERGNPNGAW